jgi:tetratricopeptide (TPR) repeat protein
MIDSTAKLIPLAIVLWIVGFIPAKAEKTTNAAPAFESQTIKQTDDLTAIAAAYLREGKLDLAESECSRLLNVGKGKQNLKHRDLAAIYILQGAILTQEGKYPQARKAYADAFGQLSKVPAREFKNAQLFLDGLTLLDKQTADRRVCESFYRNVLDAAGVREDSMLVCIASRTERYYLWPLAFANLRRGQLSLDATRYDWALNRFTDSLDEFCEAVVESDPPYMPDLPRDEHAVIVTGPGAIRAKLALSVPALQAASLATEAADHLFKYPDESTRVLWQYERVLRTYKIFDSSNSPEYKYVYKRLIQLVKRDGETEDTKQSVLEKEFGKLP